MNYLIVIAQVIISALLIGAILLQPKGTGLGQAWGGESTFYHTKKGLEKFVFVATIILAVLFFLVSILSFVK
jgi:protein translocase SecG subunit